MRVLYMYAHVSKYVSLCMYIYLCVLAWPARYACMAKTGHVVPPVAAPAFVHTFGT